jgi:flagellar basal-body rod protein FlgG
MMRSLSIAKTGMESQQLQLDNISNNLANVGTNGFKRSQVVFEDLLYQNMRQAGSQNTQQNTLPTGLQIGTGVRAVGSSRNFGQGNLQKTDGAYDVAVNGLGFFQVQMPDGTNAYTRDGSFKIDANGQLVTNNGFPVNPAITIPANAQKVTIGQDGTVTVIVPGSATPNTVGQIQLATFTNPAGLNPLGGNVYGETAASGAPTPGQPGTNGLGTLAQGFIETSNVNVVEELVAMIATQRAYEINSKAVSTVDQMLQRLSQL